MSVISCFARRRASDTFSDDRSTSLRQTGDVAPFRPPILPAPAHLFAAVWNLEVAPWLDYADAGDARTSLEELGYAPALGHMNRPPHRECTLKRLGHVMDDDGLGQISLSRRRLLSVLGAGAFGGVAVLGAAGRASAAVAHRLPPRSDIVDRYSGVTPRYWGMYPPGSWSTFSTTTTFTENSVCLTFDACGSTNGSGYDSKLISVLRERRVPATLFINRRWAWNNPEIFS